MFLFLVCPLLLLYMSRIFRNKMVKFHSLPRYVLLLKMLRLGISGKFYKIVKHMYTSGISGVRIPAGVTEEVTISAGIKQGDSLSPTLFNLFLEDFSQSLQKRRAAN